jgi:hypothetical protein
MKFICCQNAIRNFYINCTWSRSCRRVNYDSIVRIRSWSIRGKNVLESACCNSISLMIICELCEINCLKCSNWVYINIINFFIVLIEIWEDKGRDNFGCPTINAYLAINHPTRSCCKCIGNLELKIHLLRCINNNRVTGRTIGLCNFLSRIGCWNRCICNKTTIDTYQSCWSTIKSVWKLNRLEDNLIISISNCNISHRIYHIPISLRMRCLKCTSFDSH